MNKKTIFFDFDGTIYDIYNDVIPESAVNALKRLRANGHTLFLATSKGINYVPKVHDDFVFENYICLNGSYIEIDGKCIYSNTLDVSKTSDFLLFCEDNQIEVVAVNKNEAFTISNSISNLIHFYSYFKMKPPSHKSKFNINDIVQFNIAITKEKEYILEQFIGLKFLRMNKFGGTVICKTNGKDHAIKYLLSNSIIEQTNTIAFGDGDNDIDMFRVCDFGIALGNASDSLKRVSNYITDHVSDNGLYNACLILGLFD